MKSILAFSVALAAMLAGPCAAKNLFPESLIVARDDATAYTYEGCFKSAGSLTLNSTNPWQSKQRCHDACAPIGAPVESTSNGDECWCGSAVPPKADKVDDSQCNVNCTGYPQEMCKFHLVLRI
jgi:cell wall integrity and stress response component